jgi:hypothetical protein
MRPPTPDWPRDGARSGSTEFARVCRRRRTSTRRARRAQAALSRRQRGLLRSLPTRNDCLQENRVLVLDERHQGQVVLALDDEDVLAGVAVRVLQDVDQVAASDVEGDVLESDAWSQISTTCAQKAHIGMDCSVPTSVPKRGRRPIIRQPTPTKVPTKNGPKSRRFRPVLQSLAALANRRLQPLGHHTADGKCS